MPPPRTAVILTNKIAICAPATVSRLFSARRMRASARRSAVKATKATGGGLAWGGCSPTLTPNLVMFTDKCRPRESSCARHETGESWQNAVLDDLPDGYQVAIETLQSSTMTARALVSDCLQLVRRGQRRRARPQQRFFTIQSYANIMTRTG